MQSKTAYKTKISSPCERMMNQYHTHYPKPNQCTSVLLQNIKAPLDVVWSVLRRFDQPQVYKKFLRNCTMLVGHGDVDSVREVEVIYGMPVKMSRERLDRLDDDMHVMTYTIIEGDHRLTNYQSTITVHEEEGGGGTVVIESYLVEAPEGNSKEETCSFINTVLGCNHRSLACVTEKLARQTDQG